MFALVFALCVYLMWMWFSRGILLRHSQTATEKYAFGNMRKVYTHMYVINCILLWKNTHKVRINNGTNAHKQKLWLSEISLADLYSYMTGPEYIHK